MERNMYIAFNVEDGSYLGKTDTPITFETTKNEGESSLAYYMISKDVNEQLFTQNHKRFNVNVEKVNNAVASLEEGVEFIFDSMDYFDLISCSHTIEEIRSNLINIIKHSCGIFIMNGVDFTMNSGEIYHFSFKVEDQLNIKGLLDNYDKESGNPIYYHPDGMTDIEFTYEELYNLYMVLYNNKIYNQIYTKVITDWINNSYTLEMYKSKEYIIDYGFSNEEIETEVNSKYEIQKIS